MLSQREAREMAEQEKEWQSSPRAACPGCQYPGQGYHHWSACPLAINPWQEENERDHQKQREQQHKMQLEQLKRFLEEKKPVQAQPEVKPTNPKDALGTNRIPLDIVSAIAVAEEALALVEGALKYGRNNYRVLGVRTTIYLGAALRHIAKYENGENRDPKTGVHHLGSARACLGVILDAEAQGKLTDDRPPANAKMSELLDAFETRVKHLKEVFKDHSPKHYTINDAA